HSRSSRRREAPFYYPRPSCNQMEPAHERNPSPLIPLPIGWGEGEPSRVQRTPSPLPLPLQGGWGEGERHCSQPGHASLCDSCWVWLFLSLPLSCWSVLFPIARFARFRASRYARDRRRKQDIHFIAQFSKLVHSTRPARPSQRPQSETSNATRWSLCSPAL